MKSRSSSNAGLCISTPALPWLLLLLAPRATEGWSSPSFGRRASRRSRAPTTLLASPAGALPPLRTTIEDILRSPSLPQANSDLLVHELEVARKEHEKEIARSRSKHPIDWGAGAAADDALPVESCGTFGPHVLSYPEVNHPHANSDLVIKTTEPVMAEETCDAIISAAERTGRSEGWASRYTLQSTQTEVHLSDLPEETRSLVLRDLVPRLCRTISRRMFTFEDGTCTVPPESLCIYDALVIKYDPRLGLSHLVAHADFGLVAATVQLNDGFEGGGTWYQCLESEEEGAGNAVGAGDGLRTGKGHVTVHAGPLWHAGAHTTGYAPRYIMTIFFLSDRHVDANRRIQNRVINALRVAEMYGESSPNPDEEKVGRAAEAAEALLGCSLKLHPLDAESHADLVPAYRRLNNLEMAVEAGRTACSIGMLTNRSRNFGTWFQLGESLVALAEQVKERGNNSPVSIMETNRLLTEAVATYREVLRLYDVQPLAATGGPSFRSSALGGLGGALRRRALSDEDTIEAGLVLEEATMVDPENVAAWSELGLLMEMAGGEAAEQAAKVCKSQVIMIGMKKRQEAEARAKQMTDKKK